MDNKAIAEVLQSIADLLELKGEQPYRVRAYQRAARAVGHHPTEAEVLAREGRLSSIPGVGESLAQKIEELLTTGRSSFYEELRAEVPAGVVELMAIPSVGPKTAHRLYAELGVESLDDLEAAILSGHVAALPRLGEKTAQNILRRLGQARRKDDRIPVGQALPVVEAVVAELNEAVDVQKLTPAGSLRRFVETVGDLDLLGASCDGPAVIGAFTSLPRVREVLASGETKASVLVEGGLQVDLRMVDPACFGSALQYFTGSKDHNVALREWALRRGLSLSEYGIATVASGQAEPIADEQAFYERLGLAWIPPELREARGEIERAEAGTLPDLIELADIKGDLHLHTDWSDGQRSIEEMAEAARGLGYEYIALTDHSGGRGIAHGLDADRLREQMAAARRVEEAVGLRIFTGSEVDIRADGSLDFDDELLAELDVVVASVHSGMGQESGRMTERILRALHNPHVDILGHPTCRLLGQRDPIEVDMEAVFRAAAETGTALEVNASPERLDLKDMHIIRARELGVPLVLSTDAHSPEGLAHMRWGVAVARRGWCTPDDILNTLPLAGFEAFLRRRTTRSAA